MRASHRADRKGDVVSKETRRYDRFGRLSQTRAGFGSTVTYLYDGLGRLSRQTVDDSPIEYAYTRCGQLAGKFLGGRANPDAAVEYEYANNGRIVARTANGVRQTFAYDKKGQLVAVRDADGKDVERYAYDKAGNMLRKTVNGKTTAFAFDRANQLVSSTCGGITTRYEYDAAGRLVKEGDKTYTYGYLDKVMAVTDGAKNYSYSYHPDGQLARANYGDTSESFGWDGLALIQRGDEQFVNEPHVGGGNPVASSKKATYFNDLLGTTVGQKTGNAYTAAALSAFGEPLPNAQPSTPNAQPFFTGKPQVEGLGYAFLMRNYRAGLGKWQTADPMGYPDGWNALAYCGNGVTDAVDIAGGWSTGDHASFFANGIYYDDRKMKQKYLKIMIAADKAVDDDQVNNYKHAMQAIGQTNAEAIAAADGFINGLVEYSRLETCYYMLHIEDNLESAARIIVDSLGQASHTYQDKLCPDHFDQENQDPVLWLSDESWYLRYLLLPLNMGHLPELFRNVGDADIMTYVGWIEGVFHNVLMNNEDLINEIFE